MKLQYQISSGANSTDPAIPKSIPVSGPQIRLIQRLIIGFIAFLGGFVIFEPAPYELALAITMPVWFLFGLRIPRTIVPLLFLFIGFNAGGIISSFQITDYMRGIIYIATSMFLGFTSVFFAIILSENYDRIRIVFNAYLAAAVITSLVGIAGYFNMPGFSIFELYGRARGAFADPNVFGPFLVAPILLLIHGLMSRTMASLLTKGPMLIILLFGLFLAFSRAAWGLAIIAIIFFYCLQLINERDINTRLRYLFLAAIGIAAIFVMLVLALQSDSVSQVFADRGQLVQSYDGGETGRFARHAIGLGITLEKPLGIAPLEIGHMFGEQIHNTFLKASLEYGWLGFICWMTILIWTLIAGGKQLFRQRPWQLYLQIAYTVFLWHIVMSYVIDIDHWRHFYLMIGIIWGCMILEVRWQRTLVDQAKA